MFARSRTLAMAALLGAVTSSPHAWALDLTRGGQPAELTVAIAGAHGVRVTLKPVGVELPPSPSLLTLAIKDPVISLRTMEKPVQAKVGSLDVEVSPSPLTVVVKSGGREVQKLVFDDAGRVSFNVGDAPVLGMGEGGQQPGRNPIAVLMGTDGWGLFVSSPWVQADLRDAANGVFIPTNNATPTAGARGGVQGPAREGGIEQSGDRADHEEITMSCVIS